MQNIVIIVRLHILASVVPVYRGAPVSFVLQWYPCSAALLSHMLELQLGFEPVTHTVISTLYFIFFLLDQNHRWHFAKRSN